MQQSETTAQKSTEEAQHALQQIEAITYANNSINEMTLQTAHSVEAQHEMSNAINDNTNKINELTMVLSKAAEQGHQESINLKNEILSLQQHLHSSFEVTQTPASS